MPTCNNYYDRVPELNEKDWSLWDSGFQGLSFGFLALLSATTIAGAQSAGNNNGTPTFKSGVNLVLVPVVVRDHDGHAVGSLRREDFELFDKGKLQQITKFTVEKHWDAMSTAASAGSGPRATATPEKPVRPFILPQRYLAYVFDDINLSSADLTWVRDAAKRNMGSLDPTDRAAVFTTSGRTTLEFTDDLRKLHEALSKLRPSPLARETVQTCPTMTYYMANTIVNTGANASPFDDSPSGGTSTDTGNPALDAAALETVICMHMGGGEPQAALLRDAAKIARGVARAALAAGNYETQVNLATLKQIVRHLGAMPGQRTLVLVSPGFLTLSEFHQPLDDLIEFANRLNVTVNALDARGLYTDSLDMDKRERDPRATQMEQQLARMSTLAEREPMVALADGTGGRLIERSNDIDKGMQQIASPPEYVYMIGFSPRDLRPDGTFHQLKIRLATKEKLNVQARRGYFASKMFSDPQEAQKEEIQQAMFAPEDMHDPAVEVRTEFFKAPGGKAELDVLTHLDVSQLRLQKADGRNSNNVTVVACVLDRNGAWVDGKQNIVKLRLKDATVARLESPGMTVKTRFDVPPGTYAVRTVVRDAKGDLMSAESSVVEIQ